MRIAILSCDGTLYSSTRLLEAATGRGHDVRILDPTHCYMNITASKPTIHYQGEILPVFDAIIPRFGPAITAYGTAVLRQFEWMRVYSLNCSQAISRARDKLHACQLLAQQGIDLPVTAYADNPDNISDLIAEVGGAPLVIKLLEGMQGIGVVLAETHNAAESVIQAFMGMNANIMVQEFIKEAGGSDIRCFVIGDEVVAAMRRQGKPGEFRSNLHRGGTATTVEISDEERHLAVQAAKTVGLEVCGVDLLRADRGPLVLEVNSSPGLEGIEKVTGQNIADVIVAYIEERVFVMN